MHGWLSRLPKWYFITMSLLLFRCDFWVFSHVWIMMIVIIFNYVLGRKLKLIDSSANNTDAEYCDCSLKPKLWNKLIDILNYNQCVSTYQMLCKFKKSPHINIICLHPWIIITSTTWMKTPAGTLFWGWEKQKSSSYFEINSSTVSGAAPRVSVRLDAAPDEEGLKVRNTQRLGHSLRETSRSRRRDAASPTNYHRRGFFSSSRWKSAPQLDAH